MEVSVNSLIAAQAELYGRIVKQNNNYKKSPKERITKEYLDGRLEILEQVWVDFRSGHRELMRSTASLKELENTTYIKHGVYDLGEEVYLGYKCELKTALAAVTKAVQSQISVDSTKVKSNSVRLPKVNIPKFSGKYSEWNTFRDLFHSLVHNNGELDGVQKLLYLKGYLTGEAEQLLSNIPITEANYARCWDLLEKRYNNKPHICHQVLNRLLNQSSLKLESAKGLKDIVDTTNDCLATLANLNIDISSWDILVIHILTLKLDSETRRQWEFNVTNNTMSDELPSYKQFEEFITKRYRAIEFLDTKSTSGYKSQGNNFNKLKAHHVSSSSNTTLACPYCKEGHRLYQCKDFQTITADVRRKFVLDNNVCFSCLRSNHLAKNCQTNFKCHICKNKHHTLLHPLGEEKPTSSVNRTVATAVLSTDNDAKMDSSTNDERLESVPVVSCFTRKLHPTLLATALVNTVSKEGLNYTIRALLDQGSQSSFITEATVQLLGLKKTPVKTQITGVGGDKALISKAIVDLEISSRVDSKVVIHVRAHVLKSITTFLPAKQIQSVAWKELDAMILADPGYHTPNRINMLLGAEVYGQILQNGVKRGPPGSPVAQCTSLGWILSGTVNGSEETPEIKVMHIVEDNNLLKKFWELEDDRPLPKEKLLTDDEKRCEEIFTNTTTRDNEGRYVVRLPLKDTSLEVTNSLPIAEKRFYSLERRLKNGDLKQKYTEVINEYLQLNHMELIPEEEINHSKAVYLPHHAVVREDKETSKVRTVFDASCKGTNNKSLNDHLLVGPSLQLELKHLVMNWRISPICLTADIVKMYRQVKVNEADIDYQRILWRNEVNEELKHYRLLRVTFGVASAPYLAVKALQQLSIDEGDKYPIAAKAVLQKFYVDDLLTGCESVLEGMRLYKEINELLENGGFSLQKWTSNSEELLQEMKRFERENNGNEDEGEEKIKDQLKIKNDEIVKVVGLTWDRRADSFHYKVDVPEELEPATKRTIISNICRFYDPLGWAGPSIIVAKMLIQKLWLTGLDWDEIVPQHIMNEWKGYNKELKMLTEISIPRWIGIREGDFIELHGFSDASQDAYAAVVYTRVVDSEGNVHVSLISAKTKVSPIKQVSIPRLELCGAVLLTRLMMEVASVMKIEKTHMHAWTDSTVVLSWLNSHPSRWKVFVANRVSEIITNLDAYHWSHVSSKCNPADAASRGQSPSDLVNNTMWFKGPEFLHENEIEYKRSKNICSSLEEAKTRNHCAVITSSMLERFSSLTKMVRVIAYCRRFAHNLKKENSDRQVGFLTTQELRNALNNCLRQCQSERFSEEVAYVKENKNLPKRNSLRSLNPFLDEENILRVGGRLKNSPLESSRKHPILIPKDAHLTRLLVMDAHKQTLHGGPTLMLCYLQARFWILGVKQIVKSVFKNCVTCAKNTGATQTQLMGQLPSSRSTPARPFKSSGVDYAGPIQIRTTKGRGHKSYKGYICLFVCMVSRAIHLEVVTDLTSLAFLQAFKRFVARRGYCSDLWSDNATCFTGAAGELKRLFRSEKGSMAHDIAETLATNGCTWHFIPSHAPNFGGLWEAGVKSVKYHLKRTIGISTLTYEELSTVLAQIEACLNSRPLSVVTGNDNDDLTVLTPGHFLVGEALVTPPDYDFETSNISSLRRWQYTQRLTQDFWRQWSQQYLTKFYKRYRWQTHMPQPQIGDVVTVREDNLPISRWLYGKVIATHPGTDNLIRVVTLKVKNGTIKRPVNKLCLLPVTH